MSPHSTFCQTLSEADNSEIEPALESIAGESEERGERLKRGAGSACQSKLAPILT